MQDDLRVVFASEHRQPCADRALVLTAVSIPCQLIEDDTGFALLVEAGQSAQAAEQLRRYDEENPPVQRPRYRHLDRLNPLPGVAGYVLVVLGVGWLAGFGAFGENWLLQGRVDGQAIRAGEWYRALTALTLHADVSHLAGNLVFGAIFGSFAGRYAGYGVAWVVIVVAAAAANLANTLLLDATHRSIGASTAVFAALGLSAGFAWRARVFADGRWTSRAGPVIAGLALLMYSGTGDGNTDIGAHLLGFLSGFTGGVLLVRWQQRLENGRLQRRAAAAAILSIVFAWILALGS